LEVKVPKQIVGSVYWIENARQTSRVAKAKEAFSDPDQAKAQALFAEASGDKRQIKLVRLAYRQFQGIRYRGENRAKVSKSGGLKRKKGGSTAKSVDGKKAKKVPKRT